MCDIITFDKPVTNGVRFCIGNVNVSPVTLRISSNKGSSLKDAEYISGRSTAFTDVFA